MFFDAITTDALNQSWAEKIYPFIHCECNKTNSILIKFSPSRLSLLSLAFVIMYKIYLFIYPEKKYGTRAQTNGDYYPSSTLKFLLCNFKDSHV